MRDLREAAEQRMADCGFRQFPPLRVHTQAGKGHRTRLEAWDAPSTGRPVEPVEPEVVDVRMPCHAYQLSQRYTS